VSGDRRPLTSIALVATVAVTGTGLAACGSQDTAEDPTARQAEVAERGASVMPFDLEATTHRFELVDNGLVQTVVADRPSDREQVALIREHLIAEAERFRRGDYSDPTAIHGEDMPGLAGLKDGAGDITVDFEQMADGARLRFTTDDPDLVNALHRWGAVQVTDHGAHAEHG
jgi:predicted LPLAT superfamily acyltransferase